MREDRARWDARYAAGDRRHDTGPAALLASWIARWPAGRALDVAAGLGRHARFLARQGWTVEAVDISLEGLRILRRRAQAAGVRVGLILADLDRFEVRGEAYDLIVQTFFSHPRLIPRFRRWLRPGGIVYFETHLAVPDDPCHSRYALEPGEARRLFARWEILDFAEGPTTEGEREIATARLIARRPAPHRSGRGPRRIRGGVDAPPTALAVAIDGPMGSGKSTVAREVARRLAFRYVDTGAMYRAIAVAACRRGVPVDDPAALAVLARTTTLVVTPGADGASRVLVDGEDVTSELRSVQVNQIVSKVARVPGVRDVLGALQRSLGGEGNVVMEGRDIGTVILPDAAVKVFLTCSPEVRAKRRQQELAASGTPMSSEAVRRILEEDDRTATTREVAPLRVAPGAVVIDSTGLTVEGVAEQIVALVERARGLQRL
ncbi:MAG TPA: (d)CMP kinase [bacterium]|nr:(d)CMP kinase [bacterium]